MRWFAVCAALAFLFLIAGCASRPPRAFSLTVSTEPEAGLRVKIDQNTYTSPCQLNVEKGQHVVEILSPQLKDISPDVSDEDVRYVFSNWDDKNTSNPRTLTIQSDVSYKALVTVEYKIEVIVQGSGSVSLATGYYHKSQVTISATPDIGWKFSKWSVDGQDVQGNPLLLNIDSPKKIICYFQVDTNNPSIPNTPTPEDGAANTPLSAVLTWNCSDPDGDNLVYDVYFGQDPNPGLVSSDQANASYLVSGLECGELYYWKVVAIDSHGAETSSPVWNFSTTRSPSVPFMPMPSNGEVNVPLDITLNWNCSDPDGDNLVYDVYFGQDPNPGLVSSDQANASYSVSSLSYSTTYYWKITAKDGNGGETEGPVWSFATKTDPISLEPNDPNPNDGAADVPINADISWNCLEQQGILFDVYFGESPNPPLLEENYPSKIYDLPMLEYSTTYYWKIIAKDGLGGSFTSSVWSFTTVENLPPAVPYDPQPENNAVGVSLNVPLSWSCYDPDGDPISYDVYFDTSPDPALRQQNITGNYYRFIIDPVGEGRTYYWKIVAKDDHGNETEGPVCNFTVTHNPEQPSNPNPTDASSVDGSNVILSWDCFDNDGDELIYDVHFGIESDPPCIALGHTSNTYDLEPLDPGATYYWRITARDGKGGITEGPIWSFETH